MAGYIEGKKYAHGLMQYMTEVINDFIVRDKVACGIEYAPAENAGIKLARSDVKWAKAHGREIFVQGEGDNVFLTSGCMLPFSEEDFTKQIENSAELRLCHFRFNSSPFPRRCDQARNLSQIPS